METLHDTPLATIAELLKHVPMIERRRSWPNAQLAWLVYKVAGNTGLDLEDWLPPWAKRETKTMPKWVAADLRLARELALVPEALLENAKR